MLKRVSGTFRAERGQPESAMPAVPWYLIAMSLGAADATDELRLYYHERPPITYTADGQAAGGDIQTLAPILAEAGITPRYESVPPQRIFAELKANQTPFCSVGWYQTEARRQFAQFSLAYGSDAPMLVLVRRDQAAKMELLGSLEALLRDRRRKLIFTTNFSVGERFDKLIAQFRTPIEPQRVPDRAALFARLQADPQRYALISPQVFAYEAKQRPALSQKLTLIQFPDMPRTEPYYLMCSPSINRTLLDRLNRAIAAQHPELQPALP